MDSHPEQDVRAELKSVFERLRARFAPEAYKQLLAVVSEDSNHRV